MERLLIAKTENSMKNNILFALVFGGLFFASCQMQEPESGKLTGEVDFSITAGIPGSISTYGDPAGSGSHNGGAMLLDPDEYDLRYILEVWTDEATPRLAYKDTKYVSENFTSEPVVFNARLIAKKYKFVFWADFVEEGVKADNYYSTSNLQEIGYKNEPIFTDDAMDAYTNVVSIDLSEQNQNIKDIKLQRPFGKIRLIATDKLSGNLQQDELPASAELVYADGTTVPDMFNALTGKASGNTRAISAVSSASVKEDAVVNGTTYTGAYFLIANYIFAADANTGYSMDVTVKDRNENVIGVRSLSQIPVQKNKLTTVIGNFYSNESTLEVIVEDPFEEPEIEMTEMEMLKNIALNGGEIMLNDDCIFSEEAFIVNPGEGKSVEINLNGHSIVSKNKNNDAILVQSGTLIINGDGNVGGKDGYYAVWATGDSKVILNGGNYFGNGACIQAKDNAQIEINGGYYKVAAPYNGVYFVINLQDNQPNKIVVKGGKFENCDPSNTGTEPAGVSDDFVADGYSSVKISDDPAVYEVVKGVGATDGQSLADAIAGGESAITLVSDITVNTPISINDANADIEIDLNGKTLDSPMSGDKDLITVSNGTITLKNGTISTMEYGAVYGGIVSNGKGVVVMEDVVYKTSGVGFYAAQHGKIVVRNSSLTAGTYCVTSNANNPDQNITVILENSTLYGSDPVLLNVPSDITIDNCDLTGRMHGAVIRGGTARITDSRITLTYDDEDYKDIANYFKDINWGSGNMVNLAALTIGNKSASAYHYPTNVTLENTKLRLAGAHGSAFPALYAYANQGEGLGVALNYNSSCQFDGNLIYGSDNIVVNGTEVEPNEQ